MKALNKVAIGLTILVGILIGAYAYSVNTYVYICTGPSSHCYHKHSYCKGLDNCSRDVKRVTKEEARRKYHRRECKYC